MRELKGHDAHFRTKIEDVSEEQFDAVAKKLDEDGEIAYPYFYDVDNKSIVQCANESPIHESTCQFFHTVTEAANSRLQTLIPSCSVTAGGASKADLFDAGGRKRVKGKVPDFSFDVAVGDEETPLFPRIVVEVGYTETYDDLHKDIKRWLLGSGGYVRCGILVKLEQPADDCDFSDYSKWKGFLEVWYRRRWVPTFLKTHVLTTHVYVAILPLASTGNPFFSFLPKKPPLC
jgi:hypothetical protein